MGEVKAGKSSLLNGLFGQEFAKVDVLPATDRVYIFHIMATRRSPVEVSPHTDRALPTDPFPARFQRRRYPRDQHDGRSTPDDHRKLRASCRSGALRLFRAQSVDAICLGTARFVQKKWLKNVVFVFQQSDLREPAEIQIIRRHLEDTAMQRHWVCPAHLSVSARKAFLARTTGVDKDASGSESGFGPLEEQINHMVTDTGMRMLKLQSTGHTAGHHDGRNRRRITRFL